MSSLYRRKSVAISNRRWLGLEGDWRRRPEPTPAQRRALADMVAGIKPTASTRWTLIRDGFLRP